jgi:GTP-binding protein
METRNVAIIAHVDHGKTTLVDALLKQTHTFRDNQKEMTDTLIMDSNDLEREKGITILSKNTAVFYKGTKINIIDTPGHADFGGEVERIMNMASGAILLVDAAEGPLPQTKFVLKKALQAGLKIILVINKIDKKDSRVDEVLTEIEDLFLELADDDSSLEFIKLYAVGRDGKSFYELPTNYSSETKGDMVPLFETILREIPDVSLDVDKPFQMLVSTLDWDNYVGRLCIGKVTRGILNKNQAITLVEDDKIIGKYKVQKLYTFEGLNKVEVEQVSCGDIIAIAGIPELNIGQTVCDEKHIESLPKIAVEEPTLKITLGANTSPLAGQEGKFVTSRQIKERLMKEKETNLGLIIEENTEGGNFVVYGRGELHLSILIETMRREGYELEVSKPQVIYKQIDGEVCEPFEEVTIEINKQYMGEITEELGKRKGEMKDVVSNNNNDNLRMIYKISDSNLIGIRSVLMNKTRGTAILNTYFLGYLPKSKDTLSNLRNGSLVATQGTKALSYGIIGAQERGILFVGPGDDVYEGMVVGMSSKEDDIEVNVTKAKKLTNNRSSGDGVSEGLTPKQTLSLEESLDFIAEDELLEVTPKSIRIRKKYLTENQRRLEKRKAINVLAA